MEINEQLSALNADLKTSFAQIEAGYATKAVVGKLEDEMKGLNKLMSQKRLEEKSHPLFGNHQVASDFVDVLRNAAAKSYLSNVLTQDSPLYVNKADLNSYGSGTGVDFVPTSVSSLFSMLLAQGGVARKNATVLNGVKGSVVLTKRNGTSTAAFTVATTNKDDSAVTAAAMGEAKVTLNPQQISALSYVSEKLLYVSAVNIAEIVAIDMIEQAGILEDNCVIKGDGTAAYGLGTGLTADSGVGEQSVAVASWSVDDVLALPSKVHESVYGSANAKYYISGAGFQTLRTKKASTSGVYFFDPTINSFTISGYPVVIWHRLDNTFAAGKFPVLFGDMSKSTVIGVGREMAIDVDRSYRFANNQAAFRLTYDFHHVNIQPSAMARLAIVA